MSANQPKNMNNATVNNFKFILGKVPEVEYFCQSVNLPSLTMGETPQPTPLIDRPLPGDKLTFGELTIDFIVDEELRSYEAIYNWMVSITTPDRSTQYAGTTNVYSQASLIVTTNASNPILEITFNDIFPTSLADLNFSTAGNADPLIGNATFRFKNYEIRRL
jgi:hypothetical protein